LDAYFTRFEPHSELTVLPPELAVLMVGVSARQAASPTASCWARMGAGSLEGSLLAPAHGAFNGAVAARLAGGEA
jgi:hypothetical protein